MPAGKRLLDQPPTPAKPAQNEPQQGNPLRTVYSYAVPGGVEWGKKDRLAKTLVISRRDYWTLCHGRRFSWNPSF